MDLSVAWHSELSARLKSLTRVRSSKECSSGTALVARSPSRCPEEEHRILKLEALRIEFRTKKLDSASQNMSKPSLFAKVLARSASTGHPGP